MARGEPRPIEQVREALRLQGDGVGYRETARRLDLPPSTVANWFRGVLPMAIVAGSEEGRAGGWCPDCRRVHVPEREPAAYAYLLGLWLGDGHMWVRGGSVALCLTLDVGYPGIISQARASIGTVVPGKRSSVSRREGCVVVTAYGRAWRCLFPQHGPGPKHLRRIALEPWQEDIVDGHAGEFARGLIHSDGWRGMNRVRVKGRDYAYPRYQFSSRSDDIRALFARACDQLGVAWRPWGRWHISVARRDAVALLDEHVGPKA